MIPYEQLAAALEKRAAVQPRRAEAADLTQAGQAVEDATSATISTDLSESSAEYEIGEVLSDDEVHS
jgi:hypothetical protein